MNKFIKKIIAFSVLSLSIVSIPSFATENIKPNIKEFFWLNCPVCASLNKHVELWDQRFDDVNVEYIPVIWDAETENDARYIYSFSYFSKQKNLNFNKILDDLFVMLILKHQVLTVDTIQPILDKNNINQTEFLTVLNSPFTKLKIEEYRKLTDKYKVETVPAFVVHDKLILRSDADSNSDFFILLRNNLNSKN